MMRECLKYALPLAATLTFSCFASAQEIQLTGPLAGAPAVRNLRQHRKGRIEVAPSISFTLLDEYQRTILTGLRINYNPTDWLAVGLWGAYGAVKLPTGLSNQIQSVNDERFDPARNPNYFTGAGETTRRLTAINVGKDFKTQLGAMNWVAAPQLTVSPFRGKLAIAQSLFVDTDAYFFAGPAFVGLSEREDCGPDTAVDCSARNTDGPGGTLGTVKTKGTKSRIAIAPTFGLGLTFYLGHWASMSLEWRGLPFSWNTGGFDTRGNDRFPDNKVNESDRQFKFNQMIGVNFGFYFPQKLEISN